MTTGYVIITGMDGDRIENGDLGVWGRVFASRNDALAEIMTDIQESVYDEDIGQSPADIDPTNHCTVHTRSGLPAFVACDDTETYYQIEEVEYP